jgi:RNA polymerase sigma-70 factor (ECF subfamily)
MPEPIETAADEALLPRIAAGDRAAFAELFRRRHGNVYRFALHMTGQPAMADDVTQDAFLVVMQDASKYSAGRSSVVAWLCGIARNHTLRRLAVSPRLVPLDELEGIDLPARTVDPVEELGRAEAIARIRAAVLALPVVYREAVALCDLQELSYADAAEALGCAVGTVRSRLHRGRALLGAALVALRENRWIA